MWRIWSRFGWFRFPVLLQRPETTIWSWFISFTDYAPTLLVFMQFHLLYILLASFIHEVKFSMHRWQVCTLHLQICMKLDMLLSKNVVSIRKVLFLCVCGSTWCSAGEQWAEAKSLHVSSVCHVSWACLNLKKKKKVFFISDICHYL